MFVMRELTVWVFNGNTQNHKFAFPSGVFSTQANAEKWIAKHGLSGTLTMYRVDTGAYDWAIESGSFRPSKPHHTTPEFIGQFGGGDVHSHYEGGKPLSKSPLR